MSIEHSFSPLHSDAPVHCAAEPATSVAQPVYCPECGLPAWVEWSDPLPSTAGPVEHVKIRCFARHWFLMPREHLE